MILSEKRLEEIELFIDENISDLQTWDAIEVLRFLIENTKIKLDCLEEESEDTQD